MKGDFSRRLKRAFSSVRISDRSAKIGIVLGSGLGDLVDKIDGQCITYASIEGFPVPTVAGHKGLLKVSGDVVFMAGRFHFYEGWSIDDVVFPIFLLGELGVQQLIVTNAAGALNTDFQLGELVLIKDHINLMGVNPLIGPNDENRGPRFPDMSRPYSQELRECARRCAETELREGVYAALSGPNYETPAEIRMLRTLGVDMVGMSTVPEVIVAAYLGMSVLGISNITNMAAGIGSEAIDHNQIVTLGKKASLNLYHLINGIIDSLGYHRE